MASNERKRRTDDDDTADASLLSSSDESPSSSYSRSDRKKRKRRHRDSREKKKVHKRSKGHAGTGRDDDRDTEVESSFAVAARGTKKGRTDDDYASSTSSYSSSSSDRRSKRKRKRRSKDKKRKAEKKRKKKRRTVEEDDDDKPFFGKYGILKTSDFHKKSRSFTIWLEEVKGVTDAPKYELQNYFKDYMEDFNTATLPHKKYYDYDKWEMEEWERNKVASAGLQVSSARQDEANHMQVLQERADRKRKEELEFVRSLMSKEKMEEMKRKAEMQAEMAHAYKIGDQETYLKLRGRLEPER